MDITTEPRSKGVYAIATVGRQIWHEDHGTWQAHGVHIQVMDGPSSLATCKLEVSEEQADERAAAFMAGIEPWVKTLRYLAVVANLRTSLSIVDGLSRQIASEQAEFTGADDSLTDDLYAYAEQADVDAARTTDGGLAWTVLGQSIVARLGRQISHGLRMALAHAPSPSEMPLHEVWESEPRAGLPGSPTARQVAADLLAAWADVRDNRDSLITWAVQDAGLERTAVQQITGVARTTINRLLPD